ncbi:hypothetical protein AB6A40_006360 [Gnathostoma spinigerum]|uniref:MRH domain-containing protein n=1 Tax=Gnathostoma spinigerum TaxID=75299 RepID=A0ABD6EK90_9BILA
MTVRKQRTKWLSLAVLFCLICSTAARLNLKELGHSTYDVFIDEIPFGFDDFEHSPEMSAEEELNQFWPKVPKITGSNVMNVTSEYGQHFVCFLPEWDNQKDVSVVRRNLSKHLVADVVSAGFYIENCIRKKLGWWTYELCYRKDVEQYHTSGGGGHETQISLGTYEEDSELQTSAPKVDRPLYFEQIYINGTLCDLTAKPRRSVVRYICDETLATNQAYIDFVDEVSACNYVIVVHTGSLCKLDSFLPVSRPRSVLGIRCKPVLDKKGAETYINNVIAADQQRKLYKQMIEKYVERADSIQRQRYARKRTSLNSPKAQLRTAVVEANLKKQFNAAMSMAFELSSELSDEEAADIHVSFNDINEVGARYESEWDEDRGNLYWFFMDPYWDRTFFPMTISYTRANNRFFTKMSSMFKMSGQDFNEVDYTYNNFLQLVADGNIGEDELRTFLGESLFEAFEEKSIPSLSDLSDFSPSLLWYETIWLDEYVLNQNLAGFEDRIIELLNQGVRYSPQDVLSKVARQILQIRSLLEMKGEQMNVKGEVSFTFVDAERIYNKFQLAYNRAVKRFDLQEAIKSAQKKRGRSIDRKTLNDWADTVKPGHLNPENLKLLSDSNPSDVQAEFGCSDADCLHGDRGWIFCSVYVTAVMLN